MNDLLNNTESMEKIFLTLAKILLALGAFCSIGFIILALTFTGFIKIYSLFLGILLLLASFISYLILQWFAVILHFVKQIATTFSKNPPSFDEPPAETSIKVQSFDNLPPL